MNGKSGRSRTKCKLYDILDSVLNRRAVVNMPAVCSAGQVETAPAQIQTPEPENENETDDEQDEHPSHQTTSIHHMYQKMRSKKEKTSLSLWNRWDEYFTSCKKIKIK